MNLVDRKFGDWRVLVANKDDSLKKDVTFPRLVHGGDIVSFANCVSGETVADGIFVAEANVKVGVGTADCMPLVILSAETGLVLHVSRKSIIKGLLDKVADVILPLDITHVFIGPHICADHFGFDWEGEEISRFKQLFPDAVDVRDKTHLSLATAVQSYFDKWGVPDERIFRDERCTFEDEQLNSYRRWLDSGEKIWRKVETATVIWREG